MLAHKTSLNKFNKFEIISSFFSDHNGMRQEVNYKKKRERDQIHKIRNEKAEVTIYNIEI